MVPFVHGARTLASACWIFCALGASAAAADTRPFPLDVARFDAAAQEVELEPRIAELAELTQLSRLRLEGVLLPDGSVVDLELRRVDLGRLELGFVVDGRPAPGALARLDLSVWTGQVAGDSGSDVALAFSRFGSRGWVKDQERTFHLLALPGATGGWDRSVSRWVSDARLASAGLQPQEFCRSDDLALNAASRLQPHAPNSIQGLTTTLYKCRIAVETDYQLHQKFGNNLGAETSYVTSLIAWASYRYEEQIQTVLTYPYVQFYTTPLDPWTTQETGGDCVALLYEFRAAWQNNIPTGADIGHFLSGASLGCGVAWLPGLCQPPFNFSVSGNINGQLSFPVTQGPSNWDFMVMTHEIGHNFGAPHTHDYCPPLDRCAPSGYFGQCQSQQVCTSQGTLMSYCHLCSGGLSNITTYFHPASVFDMRTRVESTCLPVYNPDPSTYCTGKTNSQGCVGAISYSGHPTLTGLDDFHVRAANVINNKVGLLFWGYGSASVPFQGGLRCVAAPVVRAPQQGSAGNPPPDDCSGTYDFFWSHAYFAAKGVGAGAQVYCQWWSRDTGASFGAGLTDALEFLVGG